MTYDQALDYWRGEKAREQISNQPGSDLLTKSRHMTAFNQLADTPGPGSRPWTIGDVIHGSIGAALGGGFAKGLSEALGFSKRMTDKVETIGMGLGAAKNLGVIKRAESETRHAFRLGAVKALVDSGYFDKTADQLPLANRLADRQRVFEQKDDAVNQLIADDPDVTDEELDDAASDYHKWASDFEKQGAFMPFPVVSLDPTGLLEIPKGIGRMVTGTGGALGSAAAHLDAADESDVDIAKIQVQRELLQQELEKLRADRRNAILRQVLAKRRQSK